MVLTAVRGALGFLSRLPVAHDDGAWTAFEETPAAFPLAGYVVGLLVAVPFLLDVLVDLPGTAVAAAYLAAVYLVTGVNHADGVADCGDAAVVHGDADRRRGVLKDSEVGVGAVLALGLVVAGLALGALGAAALPLATAAGLVVAAEVGAKLGMAAVACLGDAAVEGYGSGFTRNAEPALLAGPLVASLPAALLTGVSLAAPVAVLAGLGTALLVVRWAAGALGGVNGDVFGAANELGRVAALHLGVVAWHLA